MFNNFPSNLNGQFIKTWKYLYKERVMPFESTGQIKFTYLAMGDNGNYQLRNGVSHDQLRADVKSGRMIAVLDNAEIQRRYPNLNVSNNFANLMSLLTD